MSKWIRRGAMLLALLGTASSGLAIRAGEPTERDVEFARIDDRPLKLDLYLPTESGAGTKRPLVVWVHGGAWRAGSRGDVPVTRWLTHGVAIASVDYRLSPEARFPAQSHDIKAAIRFLRAHAEQWGLDADRFVIAGSSAGGHLAALVGVTNGVEPLEGAVGDHSDVSSDVQAIVSFYGASNLASILKQSTAHGLGVRIPALQLLLGGQPQDVPELARLASPVAHVDARDPPLWLIHGDADPQMPPEQSQELATAYRRLKRPVGYEVIAGGKHGGAEFFADARLDQIAQELLAALGTTRVISSAR